MSPITSQPWNEQGESNLKGYWQIIQRRKRIVIGFCVLATLIVSLVSLTQETLYRASSTILIENEESRVLDPTKGRSGSESFDALENYIQTQMSLILSRSVAGEVFENLGLIEEPRYRQKMKKFGNQESLRAQQAAYELFLKDIELKRIEGTRALTISVYNPDPFMAAEIANAVANNYARDNLARRGLRFIRDQRMSALNSDYIRLRNEYDSLSNRYGEKHPQMVYLRNEIRNLAERIRSEEATGGADERTSEPRVLGQEEEVLLLDDVLGEIQRRSVLSSSQMNNIVVAEKAVPPAQPAMPNTPRDIFLGFFGSLFAGLLLAFFVDYLDDRINDEDVLKRTIGNNRYLGGIPYDDRYNGIFKRSSKTRLMVEAPHSGNAEAYRLIRVQMEWESRKREIKDIAVISSIPGEGKSTIASNLAMSLAQGGHNVLLVDTDIRCGRLDKSYKTSPAVGLGHYLTDGYRVRSIVQKTDVDNLWMITAGESPISSSELMSSSKMAAFVEETRKVFDYIIYDTAPITIISDASALLTHLDAAIIVSRIGVTRRRFLLKSISMIENSSAKLMGIVLNGVEQEQAKNQYYLKYFKTHKRKKQHKSPASQSKAIRA